MKLRGSLLAVALSALACSQQSDPAHSSVTRQVLLTVYSPHGPRMLMVPGRKSWTGHLWLDHVKVGFITPGQFLTLRLSGGDHSLAGEAFLAHESSNNTVISLRHDERYFARLVIENKAVAGIGRTRWFAEQVSCEEAYSEAAALEPVKLKRIEKPLLNHIARESYFPECQLPEK